MLKAHNQSRQWVWAKNAIRGEKYFCPACGQPLKVRLESKYKIDHFAHLSLTNCSYGSTETPEHEEQKKSVFDALQRRLGIGKCGLEEPFPDGQRPDIWFESTDGIVAVEIQRSRITDMEYAERNASYAAKNVASFWMVCNLKSYLTASVLDTDVPSIPAWVRRLGKPYRGIVFDQATLISGSDMNLANPWQIAAVKLKPVERIERDADGTPFTHRFFDYDIRIIDVGHSKDIEDEHGWKARIWLPKVLNGSPHHVQKKVTKKREHGDDNPYAVHCNRSSEEATTTGTVMSNARSIEEIVEERYDEYMSNLDEWRRNEWLKHVASNRSTDNQLL